MHPYLFEWTSGGQIYRVPTYGVLLAAAFSSAYFLSLYRAFKLDEHPRHVENLFLLVVLSSVLGSRLFHVVFEEPSFYMANPQKIFAIWEGGYTFYGALLAALLAVSLYCRAKKLSFLQYADIATPSTLFGLFLGRIGCFCAACCWWKPTKVPWAVTFTDPHAFTTMKGIPVHPTQLYESFGALILFFYTLWRFRNRKYEGQIFFHALILYAILRFCVEMYRGDDYRGYIFGGLVSYSQFVSLAILPVAIAGIFVYSNRDKAKRRH